MKTKTFFSFGLVAIAIIISFQPVFATLGVWKEVQSGTKVHGNSYAYGQKRVSKPNSSMWLAEIGTGTTPLVSIPVGWTYWTSRERCNGNITQQVVHSGRSVVAQSTYDYQYMTILACAGTRAGQVLGRHEVIGNISTWRYDWTQSDTVP